MDSLEKTPTKITKTYTRYRYNKNNELVESKNTTTYYRNNTKKGRKPVKIDSEIREFIKEQHQDYRTIKFIQDSVKTRFDLNLSRFLIDKCTKE